MTRTEAREFMMQLCFQMESTKDFDIDKADIYFKDKKIKGQMEYCNEMLSLLCNKKDEIDRNIDLCSNGWKVSRMPKTDLAVARIAACEIMFIDDIPTAVSVNEAVDMAKKYGTDESGAFINGLLGRLVSNQEAQ